MSEDAGDGRSRKLLDRYRKHWGMPAEVVQVAHGGGRGFRVLAFSDGPEPIARIVTLGLGGCVAADGARLERELLLVIGRTELRELGARRVIAFVADVGVHLLTGSVRPVEGDVMPCPEPAPWDPDAVLFDRPRGEPEDLERLSVDGHALRLVWAVPIYGPEADLVLREGLAALDLLVEISDRSLVDVRRPSLR